MYVVIKEVEIVKLIENFIKKNSQPIDKVTFWPSNILWGNWINSEDYHFCRVVLQCISVVLLWDSLSLALHTSGSHSIPRRQPPHSGMLKYGRQCFFQQLFLKGGEWTPLSMKEKVKGSWDLLYIKCSFRPPSTKFPNLLLGVEDNKFSIHNWICQRKILKQIFAWAWF